MTLAVVSSSGGDGRGGGRVFSRGKGDHVVVGDASPRQGCGIHAVWAWTIFMSNSFGAISPTRIFLFALRHGAVCSPISFASLPIPFRFSRPFSHVSQTSCLHSAGEHFHFSIWFNSICSTVESGSCCRALRVINDELE